LANVEIVGYKKRDTPKVELIESAKVILKDSMVADSEEHMWNIWCKDLEVAVD